MVNYCCMMASLREHSIFLPSFCINRANRAKQRDRSITSKVAVICLQCLKWAKECALHSVNQRIIGQKYHKEGLWNNQKIFLERPRKISSGTLTSYKKSCEQNYWKLDIVLKPYKESIRCCYHKLPIETFRLAAKICKEAIRTFAKTLFKKKMIKNSLYFWYNQDLYKKASLYFA